MEAIFGAVICIIAIVIGVRLLKFGIRMVCKLFDAVEDWF